MKKFKSLAIPYQIWMGIFVLIPLIMMVVLSFLDVNGFDFKEAQFSFVAFRDAANPTYAKAFYLSVKYAFITTVICIALGYPIAYFISKTKSLNKYILLFVLIMPMWTNMMLRIKAIEMLSLPEGLIKNTFGVSFDFYGTGFAVVFGMVAMYLPFMIFPIFTVLEKINPQIIDAAKDLGATPRKTFLKVILPLSMKGVITGIIMVFLPAAMGFAISEILGAGRIQLIGNIIENFFKRANIYNLGSLLSLIIIVIVLGSLYLFGKVDADGELFYG